MTAFKKTRSLPYYSTIKDNDIIIVVDVNTNIPSQMTVLEFKNSIIFNRQTWRDVEGNLWEITRDINGMEIKTLLI